MATQPALATERALTLQLLWSFPRMRALAWSGNVLYASREYVLYTARTNAPQIDWHEVGRYRPSLWRRFTSKNSLAFRSARDGFHGLAVLPNGNVVGAVPGAIVTLRYGDTEFEATHRIQRGTRPLNICATPAGHVFWGEYFDNKARSEVHIYASTDGGETWQIAHTFAAGEIRHVHNIVYDQWQDCLWIFTGDYGKECRILRASFDVKAVDFKTRDFKIVDEVLAGNQQARAVAAVPTREGLYFASDTPLEQNYIYLLDRPGETHQLCEIPSSSIAGCRNSQGIFFSTMVEPSRVNPTKYAEVFGSAGGTRWHSLGQWRKNHWPMRFFQYGAVFFPAGGNHSDLLAISTIALTGGDQTTIFRTVSD
jgi:hypothetical protein